jgi:hypothetical protein
LARFVRRAFGRTNTITRRRGGAPATLVLTSSEGLWRSVDDGANWSLVPRAAGIPSFEARSVIFDATDPLVRWLRTSSSLSKTTDGGTTWSNVADEGSSLVEVVARESDAKRPDLWRASCIFFRRFGFAYAVRTAEKVGRRSLRFKDMWRHSSASSSGMTQTSCSRSVNRKIPLAPRRSCGPSMKASPGPRPGPRRRRSGGSLAQPVLPCPLRRCRTTKC